MTRIAALASRLATGARIRVPAGLRLAILALGVLVIVVRPIALAGAETGARGTAPWYRDATKLLSEARVDDGQTAKAPPLSAQQRKELQERKRTARRILALLDGPNPRGREQAAEELAQLQDPIWVAPLWAELATVSGESAKAILRVLSQIDSDEAERVLAVVAIAYPDEGVRTVALNLITDRPETAQRRFRRIYQRAVEITLRARAQLYLANTCRVVQQLRLGESLPDLISMLVNNVPDGVRLVGQYAESLPVDGGTTKYARWNVVPVVTTVQNECVLQTLKQMTKVDYGYDQMAWQRWWQSSGSRQFVPSESVATDTPGR